MNILSRLCRPLIVLALVCAATTSHPITRFAAADTIPANPALSAPYTLRFKFAQGTVWKFSVATDINSAPVAGSPAPGMNFHSDATETQTVQSIMPSNGNATIESVMATTSALINGQPLPPDAVAKMSHPPITTIMSTTGQMISQDTGGSQPGGLNLGSADAFSTLAFLPTQPVNVGDTWSTTFPITKLNVSLACTMVLKSVQIVHGDNVATIDVKVNSVPASAGAAAPAIPASSFRGDFLLNFDIDSGSVDSSSGNMAIEVSMPQQSAPGASWSSKFKMNMKISMTALPQATT